MLDVCLLLEGTYPYVAGGVSTWIHDLLGSMKDLRFGLVTIFPHSDPTRTVKYDIPPHVLFFKEIFLHDYELKGQSLRRPKNEDYHLLEDFYQNLFLNRFDSFGKFVDLFQGHQSCFDVTRFFHSPKIWDFLLSFYKKINQDISFVDFFWTWRSTHLPLIHVLQSEVPEAKIYHSISTGYAGLLGAAKKATKQGKFILTEHGIYTHERMLEITQAHWIYEKEKRHYRPERELSFFKQWWVTLFEKMSRIAYHYADQVFTLYEGNRLRQILEGAQEDKIQVIPNGIDIKEYGNLQRKPRSKPQIGFIGRVVSIKDVKTFIQAIKQVAQEFPDASFYIIGPIDEEENYYDECRLLVETLDLENCCHFTGRVDVKKYYEFLDIVVLTSLSEAQPYVILEANMAGIPIVATDVGACRELLEGRTLADQNLGRSGLITEVSNPQKTSLAISQLLNNPELYQRLAETGPKRVSRYYHRADLFSRYLNVYEKNF